MKKRFMLLLVFTTTLITGLCSIVIANIIAEVNVTRIGLEQSITLVYIFLVLFIVVVLLRFLSDILLTGQMARYKKELYRSLIFAPFSDFLNMPTSEVLTRLDEDYDKIISYNYQQLPTGVANVVVLLVYLIYVGRQSLQLSFLLCFIGLIALVVPLIFKKAIKVSYEGYMTAWDDWAEHMLTTFEGFEFFRGNNGEKYLKKTFFPSNEALKKASYSIDKTAEIEQSAKSGVFLILKILWILLLSIVLNIDRSSIGELAAFAYLGIRLIDGIPSIIATYYAKLNADVSLDRIKDITQMATHHTAVYLRDDNTPFDQKEVGPLSGYWNAQLRLEELTLNQNDIVAAEGANGMGKSTFLRQMNGLLGKTSDKDLSSGVHHITYSYLPQSFSFIGESVEQVLTFFGTESNAKAHLNALGGDSIYTTLNPNELSGGEIQKLGLALALSQESEIILLDEPTNHLDMESVHRLADILKKIDKPIIMVSHDKRMVPLYTKNAVIKEVAYEN